MAGTPPVNTMRYGTSTFAFYAEISTNANSRVGATYAGDIDGFGTKFGGGGSSNL